MKTKLLLSTLLSGLLLSTFTGCGSSTDDTVTTASLTASGQLVDSYLENVDYHCGDGSTGITDLNGSFSCLSFPVTFSLGGLQLGEITALNSDRQVFPQDLLHVARTDVNNSDVIAMARFVQACDDDSNSLNGIRIQTQVKEALQDINETFNAQNINLYAADANITLVDDDSALSHLEHTLTLTEEINNAELPTNVKDALLTPNATLTQEAKNTLAYMGNEERLAYDVYNYLYNYHQENSGVAIKQLTNIATKSEYKHIQTVQFLVKKYITTADEFTNTDLPELGYKETPIEDMQAGTYDISAIQNLYDALTAKGVQSQQDALEVGCMVEATDIYDLLDDIEIAKESNASDIVSAFEFLRDGSYSHYWAFDKGLKNMGITEGCCSLGDEYCHPEYPSNK